MNHLDTVRSLVLAQAADVSVGAGLSYPVGKNSSITMRNMTDTELHSVIGFQLAGLASLTGGRIPYVTPHGDLYFDAQTRVEVARVVAYQADVHGAAVMGQPGSQMERVCAEFDVPFIAEVFAYRRYDFSGALIRSGLPRAEIASPAIVARHAVQMVTERKAQAWGYVPSRGDHAEGVCEFSAVDSISIPHTGAAFIERATAIRDGLLAAGVEVRAPLAVAS